METLRPLIHAMVLVAGFVNAFAIGMQAVELLKTKKSEGFSVFMFYVFLFIQFSLALNGLLHNDWWQVHGMVASMLSTVFVIVLIYKYRTRRTRKEAR